MGYTGSKSQAGVWQRIISNMPPHDIYVEPFLGSGQIFWRKRPASTNVVIDMDAGVIEKFDARIQRTGTPFLALHTRSIVGNSLVELATLKTTWRSHNVVVYADPPYLFETRNGRKYYPHEFGTPDQHAALLDLLDGLGCYVLLSGYPSKLYQDRLKKWRCISYRMRTHRRTLTECLWCNFPEPQELHDYRFIGRNHRERTTIKRQLNRWVSRLNNMPALKRGYILQSLQQRHK